MNFNTQTRYAVFALGYLARNSRGCLATSEEMAQSLRLSAGFLSQALNLLVKARLVHGVRGPNGGFCLTRPAREISLLDVVEAMDGLVIAQLDSGVTAADNSSVDRRLQDVLERIAETYRQELRRVRLSALCRLSARCKVAKA